MNAIAHRHRFNEKPITRSFLEVLGNLLLNLLSSWGLGCGGSWLAGLLILFLGLQLLLISILDVLLGRFDGLISGAGILITSSLDFFETHTDDSLLDSCGLSSFLSLNFLNSNFLVLSSPCLGPSKFNSLDLLVVKRSSFGGNEVMDLTILTSKLGTSTGPDFHL